MQVGVNEHIDLATSWPSTWTLARANSVNAIGGREVCSLAWTPSTTMRENSTLDD